MLLKNHRDKTDAALNFHKGVKKALKEKKSELVDIEEHLETLCDARSIIQNVSQEIQRQAHEQITAVVNRCLEAVFDDTYGFRIDFVSKRGRTEANLLLLKDGHEIEDPMNEDSGGVLDIASLALRLSCLVLSKPQLRKVLVLDQPFTNVSEEYHDRVRYLIEGLSEDFGVQFIIVNHVPTYYMGKIVKI